MKDVKVVIFKEKIANSFKLTFAIGYCYVCIIFFALFTPFFMQLNLKASQMS
jgi:hypothetical protein